MAKKHKAEKMPHSVMAYYRYTSIRDFGSSRRLRGPYRVILFCLLTILTPILLLAVPLYLRYQVYGEATYFVGESDLVSIDRKISTFWCEGQDLWMNATFHAYLLSEPPENSEDLQRVELDKHMKLADDSLEYWGFYLLGGSKVTLSVCSKFNGARLMVVKGTRNLKHCALIEPPSDQDEPWEDDVSAQKGEKIEVIFEGGDQQQPVSDSTQVITSSTSTTTSSTTSRSAAAVAGNSTAKPVRTSRKKQRPTPVPAGGSLREDQEIHQNVKVRRHKHTHALPKERRRKRKRFVETEPDRISEEQISPDDSLHSDEEVTYYDDVDEPPNPVGVEPDDNQVVQAITPHAHKNQNQDQDPFETNYQKNNNQPDRDHNDDVIDKDNIRSSGVSFAKNLWTCYGEDTVFTQTFSASQRCQSQDALLKHALRMRTVHEIASSGYYYYIFYSDNDIVLNDIFAKFTIEKVVYNFPNASACRNVTACHLNLTFLSNEKVLLEVPLQDGVSDEDALSQMLLLTTCNPRLAVYFIFPVLILFSILCCAFI